MSEGRECLEMGLMVRLLGFEMKICHDAFFTTPFLFSDFRIFSVKFCFLILSPLLFMFSNHNHSKNSQIYFLIFNFLSSIDELCCSTFRTYSYFLR